MSALCRVTGVSRRFGDVTALREVSLEVGAGELVGLLGANGAGKTTLVRVLLGLVAPSEGRVELFGDAPSRATRRRIGYVPQGLGLYDDLTPGENLAFTRAVYATRGDAATPRDAVTVGSLPLGRQREVAFLEALDHAPDLLVLDEPTSGVGPLAAARLLDVVREAAERGTGAILATHSLEEAEQCDRLVVMSEGRVVAAGTPIEIVGTSRVLEVAAADWAGAFAALGAAGLDAALVGARLRVAGATRAQVEGALVGLDATVAEVGATLEERFVELSRASR